MTTALTTRVRKLTSQVTSSLTAHALPAALALEQRPGDEAPLLLNATLAPLAARLEHDAATVEQAEAAVVREGAEDTTARQHRDGLLVDLLREWSATASGVETIYGRTYAAQLKLTGSTPTSAQSCIHAVEGFLAVSDPLPAPPSAASRFQSMDLISIRGWFAGTLPQLRAAVLQVDTDQRETQLARDTRDAALQRWQQTLRFAAHLGQELLRYNGQPGLADRMFPSERAIREVTPDPEPSEPSIPQPEA